MSIKPFFIECVSTRESNVYVEGLNSKVKLELYKICGMEVEFKRLRGTLMGLVMLELDSCLNLGQEHMV